MNRTWKTRSLPLRLKHFTSFFRPFSLSLPDYPVSFYRMSKPVMVYYQYRLSARAKRNDPHHSFHFSGRCAIFLWCSSPFSGLTFQHNDFNASQKLPLSRQRRGVTTTCALLLWFQMKQIKGQSRTIVRKLCRPVKKRFP